MSVHVGNVVNLWDMTGRRHPGIIIAVRELEGFRFPVLTVVAVYGERQRPSEEAQAVTLRNVHHVDDTRAAAVGWDWGSADHLAVSPAPTERKDDGSR